MSNMPADSTLAVRCAETAPALLLRGIAEFNSGRFYECHETLEALWRAELGPVRSLYQGVLQVGVGCYHAQRGNRTGAVAQLLKGIARLEQLPAVCQSVQVGTLRIEAAAYLRAVTDGSMDATPPVVEVA